MYADFAKRHNKIKLDIRSLLTAMKDKDDRLKKLEDLVVVLQNKLTQKGDNFEKFTSDSTSKIQHIEEKVKLFEKKHKQIEKQITEVNTEDLEERLIGNERELESFQQEMKKSIEVKEAKIYNHVNMKSDTLAKSRDM